MRKKLLFVVNVDWFFVSHRLPIALAAKKAGYEVHLACQFTDKKSVLDEYGLILHDLPISRSGTSLSGELSTFLAIRKLIHEIVPDVLHMVTIKPVLYAGLASRGLKQCLRIVSISGLGYIFVTKEIKASLLRRFVSLFYRLAMRHPATTVIFQNPSDRELFKNLGIIEQQQTVMIKGSGVFLDQYSVQNEPEGIPVIILVSRLLSDKGVYEFVEAARILKSIRVKCRMAMVGTVDENPKSITSEEIVQWCNESMIEYWGFTKDVSQTMSKANIVVLPSYREGLPKALIEAAASGRAVITTDVPGCRDAIIPNKTGLLVPPKNSIALAQAIQKLCLDKNRRKFMASAGRHFAEREFDINRVIATHLKLYSGE